MWLALVTLCNTINLKGRWLEEPGFITGMPVTVTVERGGLLLRRRLIYSN
ncbi:SymE family type I addiction module toxin [Pectobacterium polonicum]|uniref:Type I toxin-antitoxin system SymE family toxin n=1 Tax=Pectobacterium polonicum TaxID=2485124 RepID=A0AAE9NLU5_9GAMM|nr:SymE family type I addiction module toxin [Pectobacterium polonicum]UVO07425.1 type I toxin-antitoxin system SymE family toxin [Pectobacterium polonicum]